jgi:hypothetical protein
VGNLQADWLTISSVLGTTIFMATNIGMFVWLIRYQPNILYRKGKDHVDTTLDWRIIGEIVFQCSSFSGGVILLLNVSVFILTGIWNIDARSLGVMALAFALTLFRSFDGFVTELKRLKV